MTLPSRSNTGCLAPPGTTETAQQSGHISEAKSTPWSTAIDSNGTFKSADKLRAICLGERVVDLSKDTITYYRMTDDQPPLILETACTEAGVDDNDVLLEEFDGYGRLLAGTDRLYAAFACTSMGAVREPKVRTTRGLSAPPLTLLATDYVILDLRGVISRRVSSVGRRRMT